MKVAKNLELLMQDQVNLCDICYGFKLWPNKIYLLLYFILSGIITDIIVKFADETELGSAFLIPPLLLSITLG